MQIRLQQLKLLIHQQKFAGVTSPLDTSSADFEVLYSETVKFDENENVINREVSGTETRTK